jgi:putative ABC transport system permease protein
MALGAGRGDILRLILGTGGRLILGGAIIGIGASVALAQIIKSQVFLVPLLDPWALGAAVGLLSTVGLLACYLPARRATRVLPMVALRAD